MTGVSVLNRPNASGGALERKERRGKDASKILSWKIKKPIGEGWSHREQNEDTGLGYRHTDRVDRERKQRYSLAQWNTATAREQKLKIRNKRGYEGKWERKGKKQREDDIITEKESEITGARVRSNADPNIYVSDAHTYIVGKEKKSKRKSESKRGSKLKDKVEIENKIKGENEDKSEHEKDSECYSETKRNRRRTSDSMSESDRTSKQHTHTRVNRVEEHDKERDKVRVEEQARTHKRSGQRDRDHVVRKSDRKEGGLTFSL